MVVILDNSVVCTEMKKVFVKQVTHNFHDALSWLPTAIAHTVLLQHNYAYTVYTKPPFALQNRYSGGLLVYVGLVV